MIWLRRGHLLVGIAGIVAFLATGLYMDQFHGHLRGYDSTLRMLYRSTHIYVLLAATTNAMTGLYLQAAPSGWRQTLQVFGSLALLAAPVLFIVAFCTEPYLLTAAREALPSICENAGLSGFRWAPSVNLLAQTSIEELARPWTKPAIYLTFAGTLFHLIAGIPQRGA